VSAAAGYVAVLVELDMPSEARAFAVQALEQCNELGILALSHDIVRELALAEAMLHDFARAAERLDALIEQRAHVMASRLAMDYEARARVAILARDTAAATRCLQLIAVGCRSGRDARMLARHARLLVEARRAGLPIESGDTRSELPPVSPKHRVRRPAILSKLGDAFRQTKDAGARAERALGLLCEASRVQAGQLYIVRDTGLSHTATLGMQHDSSLDEFVKRYWTQQIADFQLLAEITQGNGEVSEIRVDTWANQVGALYRLLCLQAWVDGNLALVGVAALRAETAQVLPMHVSELATVIAERLIELGDVHGVPAR
jgi:hypothetical protein